MTSQNDDSNRPAVLTTVDTETQAALIVAALEEAGIDAHVSGALTSGFRAEAPGRVQVVVRASDLDRANAELERLKPTG